MNAVHNVIKNILDILILRSRTVIPADQLKIIGRIMKNHFPSSIKNLLPLSCTDLVLGQYLVGLKYLVPNELIINGNALTDYEFTFTEVHVYYALQSLSSVYDAIKTEDKATLMQIKEYVHNLPQAIYDENSQYVESL